MLASTTRTVKTAEQEPHVDVLVDDAVVAMAYLTHYESKYKRSENCRQ